MGFSDQSEVLIEKSEGKVLAGFPGLAQMVLSREEAKQSHNKEVAKRLKFVKDLLRNKVDPGQSVASAQAI